MTLEEAIIHAEEVVDRCEVTDGDRACAEEHRQLAKWLKELAERRKQPEIIRCKDCADWGTNNCAMSQAVDYNPDYDWTNPDGYCHMAERRTEHKGLGLASL